MAAADVVAPAAEAALEVPSSIAKQLASCNARTRNNAIRLLHSHLSSQPSVCDDDMRKIWKGLFYCFWHADKQPYQISLADSLSSLVASLPRDLSLLYFSTFLSTIRREWSGIDSHRLDKFYLLIRRFLRKLFFLFHSNCWNSFLLDQFIPVLFERTLFASVTAQFLAPGVNYHISEVFLEELSEFLPLPGGILDVLLKPFMAVLEKSSSSDKVLVNKVLSGVFNRLLENGRKLLDRKSAEAAGGAEENLKGDEVEKFGGIAVGLGLSATFFAAASGPDTVQCNRKTLFGLHEAFLKLEKDFEKLGFTVLLPGTVEPKLDQEVTMEALDTGASVPREAENGVDAVKQEQFEEQKEGAAVLEAVYGAEKKSRKVKKATNGVDAVKQEQDDEAAGGSEAGDVAEKKSKKAKKFVNGVCKKTKSKKNKKKKNKDGLSADDALIKDVLAIEDDNGGDIAITLNESLMSNLQKQFEQVAAEAGMDVSSVSLCVDGGTMPAVSRKRKRAKNIEVNVSNDAGLVSKGCADRSAVKSSAEKSAKKVKFSMKNNLVWKPHSPLPPQSLRLPPSTTPRGSALKKGIPPGPVREGALVKKVKYRNNAVKKARKGTKGVASAAKRLRKLRTITV